MPTDPGYAPFGWRPLRGLNASHVLVVAMVCLTWRVGGMLAVSERVPIAEELPRIPIRLLLSTAAFMPTLVMVTLVLAAWRLRAARIAGSVAAVLLGALLHTVTLPASYCLVGLLDVLGLSCEMNHWGWDLLSTFLRASLWGSLFAALMLVERQSRETARALHLTEVKRHDAERQQAEARLRSLQAQVEPHFLFNTLAHIQHLQQASPQQGLSMLRSLVDYMRAALPQMREPESTLRREVTLTRAYLEVQQVRMGRRLRFEIEVPEDLLDAALPPMMLLGLAENAIKHGLGPRRDGGRLDIRARRQRDRLVVEVCDDGVGLRVGAGCGRGLSNTRARLLSLFGREARLDIDSRVGGGVHVTLALPLSMAASASAGA